MSLNIFHLLLFIYSTVSVIRICIRNALLSAWIADVTTNNFYSKSIELLIYRKVVPNMLNQLILAAPFYFFFRYFFYHGSGFRVHVGSNAMVAVRPVLMVAESERVDMIGNDAFRFEGTGVSTVAGRNVNITCPVIAFPTASHTWTKDGKPLGKYAFSSGHLILFESLEYRT